MRKKLLYTYPGTPGVYALVDPRSGVQRYVGSSSNIEARYTNHCRGADTNTRKKEWVAELKALGLKPLLSIISVEPDARRRVILEFNYIRESVGACDLNIQRKQTPLAELRAENERLIAEIVRLNARRECSCS